MLAISKKTGKFGEEIAVKYLEDKGYKILERNYFCKGNFGPNIGEIDIIAKPHRNVFDILRGKNNDIIHFVEVKTLQNSNFSKNKFDVKPEDKVNFQKQRKLIKTSESWLMKNKIPLDIKWQIDVISIRVDLNSKKARIRHFENAVSQ